MKCAEDSGVTTLKVQMSGAVLGAVSVLVSWGGHA